MFTLYLIGQNSESRQGINIISGRTGPVYWGLQISDTIYKIYFLV